MAKAKKGLSNNVKGVMFLMLGLFVVIFSIVITNPEYQSFRKSDASTRKIQSCGANGLILHYDFENVSGNQVPDISGCNNTGIFAGNILPTIKTAEECNNSTTGKCVYLQQKGDAVQGSRIEVDRTNGFTGGVDSFTFTSIVYPRMSFDDNTPSGCNGGGCKWIAFGTGSDMINNSFNSTDAPPKFRSQIRTNDLVETSQTMAEYPEKHHVAFVYDHTTQTLRMYINGELNSEKQNILKSTLNWDNDINNNQYLTIGRSGVWPAVTAPGYYDEVKIWNRALTQSEICQLVGSGCIVPTPTPLPAGACTCSGNSVSADNCGLSLRPVCTTSSSCTCQNWPSPLPSCNVSGNISVVPSSKKVVLPMTNNESQTLNLRQMTAGWIAAPGLSFISANLNGASIFTGSQTVSPVNVTNLVTNYQIAQGQTKSLSTFYSGASFPSNGFYFYNYLRSNDGSYLCVVSKFN